MPRRFPKASEFDEMRDAGIGLAAKLVLEHKYDLAKDIFTKLLNLRPDDVEVMSLLANIFIVEGKLLEAENKLNNVLAFNPNYPLALYFLGVVYHDKGEYEKAIHMYETALKHFSEKDKKDIADVYQNLGCSLWENKRREEALEAWKTCLKYNPRQRYARDNLKDFTNEYGMPRSSVGMDDYYAFTDIKTNEYFESKRKKEFKNKEEAEYVLNKIMDAWNDKILSIYGAKLKSMKTKDKVKLFEDTQIF